MKASSILLATFLMAPACSSSPIKPDGGRGDALGDAGSSDSAADAYDGGTGISDARPPVLCDGEQHLRLWVLAAAGGQEAAGSYVRIENGAPVVTVDGTCTYWVSGGWSDDPLSEDRPFRTGKLSDEDVRAIEEIVPVEDLTALADCVPDAVIPDGPTFMFRTATASAICGGVTSPAKPGIRFMAAWTSMQTIAKQLWATGAAMDGGIHVSAFAAGAGATRSAYAWPIASPLSAFVPADGDLYKSGVSRLVDDPESARQLRALRDQYLADWTAQPVLGAANVLEASDESGVVFQVYMRDAIPYEDAQGLLKF